MSMSPDVFSHNLTHSSASCYPGGPVLPEFLAPQYAMPFALTKDPRRHIAGAGNHEGKTILTLIMAANSGEYSVLEMHNLLAERFGLTFASTAYTNQKEWCRASLVPCGLVETRSDGRKTLYRATELAKEDFISLGGFLLRVGETYDMSLFEIFGKSQKRLGRNDPQALGVTMMNYLVDNHDGAYKYEEISKGLKLEDTATIYAVLRRLASNGLITFEPHSKLKSPLLSPNVRTAPPTSPNAGVLAVESLNILRKGSIRQGELLRMLCETVPLRAGETPEQRAISARNCIEDFVRGGRIDRSGGQQFTGQIPVKLTADQRKLLTDVVDGLRSFSKGDRSFVSQNEREAYKFLSDNRRLQDAFERYVAASAHMRVPGKKSAEEIVIEAMRNLTDEIGITINGVSQAISSGNVEGARRLSVPTIRRILEKMAKSGQLKKDTISGVSRYEPVDLHT